MDKYILELIKLHSKVILPDFGAIVIADDETGEVMFNEYLNYNDNKLAELVEQESNMDIKEAQNHIAKFVRDIKYQLDKGENYTIYQLGEFYKENDEYYFSGNIKTGKSNRTESGQSAVASTEKEKEVVQKTEIKKEKETPKEEVKAEKSVEVEKKEAKKDKKESQASVVPPVASADSKSKDKASSTKKETKKNVYKEPKKEDDKASVASDKKSVETEKTTVTNAQTNEVNEEDELKRKPLKNLIFLLLSILIVFLAIYFNQDRITSYMGWDKFDDVKTIQETTEDIENEQEELSPATTEVAEEQETEEETLSATQEEEEVSQSAETIDTPPAEELPKVTPPSTTSVTSGNYHIIVGAFSDENNAQTLVDELQGMGFNSASIIGQFTSQNLHYVAAGSYSSMADAQSALSQVKTQKSNAWIFKR